MKNFFNLDNINGILHTFIKETTIKNLRIIFMAICIALVGNASFAVDSFGRKQPEPYTKTIGSPPSNSYDLHNFIGEDPDIIPSTAKADVRRYLEQGTIYLQTQFDSFCNSLSDRPSLQRYFAQFRIDFFNLPEENRRHHRREISDCQRMDCCANKILEAYQLVLADILKNLKKPEEREAMTLCYRALANEAYKEGLGSNRKADNFMTQKYNQEKAAVSALWQNNSFLRSVPLDHDIEYNKARRLVSKLYTLHYNAAQNMRENSSLRDFSILEKDLRGALNLALNASAIAAMHDCVVPLLNHEECFMGEIAF